MRLACFALLLVTCSVQAGPFNRKVSGSRPSGGSNLSALESATISANCGVMAHRGGSYAYEGVGFSPVSADAALRNCCYWGRREVVESAVVRGNRGWFACVRYR